MLNWGELDGRLDCLYYVEVNENKNFVKLRKLVEVKGGKRLPKGEIFTDEKTNYRYVKVENIKEFVVDKDATNYISKEQYDVLKRYELYDGEVIISIAGTVGKIAIFNSDSEEKFILTENCAKFCGISPLLDKNYLKYILGSAILQKQISKSYVQTTIAKLSLERILELMIPLPDISIQRQIVSIMDSAYHEKQMKEHQADKLIKDIDTYLLNVLGIAAAAKTDNSLKSRIFYVKSENVIGGRFDPKKYSDKYQILFDAIENSAFRKVKLHDIVEESISGNWGFDETESDEDLIKCLTIRGTEFHNNHNLLLDNGRAKYRKYTPEIFEKIKLCINDILIEKSGGSENQPVGRVAFISREIAKETLAYSNFLQKIKINENLAVPEYVFEYLRLMHNIKVTEVMQTQTNGIRNLIMSEYFDQTIILPDVNLQKEIVEYIKNVRAKAKKLEVSAKCSVEQAKKQVENILLGKI